MKFSFMKTSETIMFKEVDFKQESSICHCFFTKFVRRHVHVFIVRKPWDPSGIPSR
jgi:hypothetical protein